MILLEIKINLHPVNLVIISGVLQSIILAGVLIFHRKGNRSANRLIGLFVLICSLHFSWPLLIDTNLADILNQVFWFPYSYLLAIGPLLFFYTKSLTESNFRIGIKESVHFLPVVMEVLIQAFFIKESMQNNVLDYDVKGFLWFRIVEFIGTATSILIYGKQSLALIRTHEARMAENFSNQRDVTLLWLFKLIKYLRVLWIFWLVFELSFILFWQFQMDLIAVYLLLYTLMGVITYSNYWIGIQALTKSEVLIEKKTVSIPVENANVYSRLNEVEIKSYVEAINQLMQKEKLYLHETLSLRTLGNRLQIDPNLVSYVLNNILDKSFYDYVNEFRIEEVKRKIDDPAYSHLKMVEIGYECGFNSKATFNRVFKKTMGKSPSEYKKALP
jgi:AraC-like DNA-binding protein